MVELFFLLSGLLVFKYKKRICDGLSFRRFYLRRFFRVFPLLSLSALTYAALMLIEGLPSYLASGGVWEGPIPTLWGVVVTSLGMQEGWGLANPGINNPLWFVSVLLLCYVVFYLSVWTAARLRVSPEYFFAFAVLLSFNIGLFHLNMPFLTATTSRGYFGFFTGTLLAALLGKWTPGRRALWFCAALLALISLWLCIPLAVPFLGNQSNMMVLLYFPALILLLLYSPLKKLFDHSVFGTLGAISFDVYVWHFCAIRALVMLAAHTGIDLTSRPLRVMLLFTLCVWLFGAFSYYCIEKPIDRRIQAALNRWEEA